jgi:hypothetical protein
MTDRSARRVAAGAVINLAGIINLIATIPFQHADLPRRTSSPPFSFLGQWSGATWTARNAARGCRREPHQFALAEGIKGGQYFTPKSIVSLIVEMIEPYQGRVYDPAMGSGGFFIGDIRL